MSRTTKDPIAFARAVLEAGKEALPAYSHFKSPHKFTQPQLFAMLVLKQFFKLDYRGVVAWLSCHDFVDNQVRLQLFALAYNLGNFLRRLALPRSVKHWSLTTLREKLIKIGGKVVTHARCVIFQLAEVAVPQWLFRAILERIQRLRLREPVPT